MNTAKRVGLAAAVLGCAVLAVGVAPAGDAKIAPTPPKGADAAVTFPATTSHLSLTVTFPKAAIQSQLDNEKVIPKSFHFDVTDGVRAYGAPGRGPVEVTIDPAAKRLSASTRVSGRVQVEKRILGATPNVGIDVSGRVTASASPLLNPKWEVDPRLDLTAHLERAVAKTFAFDVDVTGLVRGAVENSFQGAKGPLTAKLKEELDLRKRFEKLWDQIGGAHKLSDTPPTWVQITPGKARFGEFCYTADAITAGLALDLEARVFVQELKPDVGKKPPLPELLVGEKLGNDFHLSLPVELSHDTVNRQLKAQLTKTPLKLRNGAAFTITDASISSYKDRILLALDFRAEQGASNTASGRMYVTGDAMLTADGSKLRLSKLAFTTDTKEALDREADWLGQADPLAPVTDAAEIELADALAQAKKVANEQLSRLKTKFSKELAVTIEVTALRVDRLVFSKDRTFAAVTATGKASAELKP
jgi:hypothetical protein